MGIGKTIWLILFCFVLLLGTGLKGYGQDRKIVIDSILYQDVMVDNFGSKFYTTVLRCACRAERELIVPVTDPNFYAWGGGRYLFDPSVTFYFCDKSKKYLIADTTIIGCTLVITEQMFEKYAQHNDLYYFVQINGTNRWRLDTLSSQDLIKKITIYPTQDDITGKDEAYQWYLDKIRELKKHRNKKVGYE